MYRVSSRVVVGEATAAFKHLLTENSTQTATQQNAFLRNYLFVYRVSSRVVVGERYGSLQASAD